jgi:hypothetical protein
MPWRILCEGKTQFNEPALASHEQHRYNQTLELALPHFRAEQGLLLSEPFEDLPQTSLCARAMGQKDPSRSSSDPIRF